LLRKIFGARGMRKTREWRRLRNEELYDLLSTPNIILLINQGEGDGQRM